MVFSLLQQGALCPLNEAFGAKRSLKRRNPNRNRRRRLWRGARRRRPAQRMAETEPKAMIECLPRAEGELFEVL